MTLENFIHLAKINYHSLLIGFELFYLRAGLEHELCDSIQRVSNSNMQHINRVLTLQVKSCTVLRCGGRTRSPHSMTVVSSRDDVI